MIKNKIIILSAFVMMITSYSNARDQIKIVGSSTVYPYSTVVAERFGKQGKFKTPVVESTGTGGGFKERPDGIQEGLQSLAWLLHASTFEQALRRAAVHFGHLGVGPSAIDHELLRVNSAERLFQHQLSQEGAQANGGVERNTC